MRKLIRHITFFIFPFMAGIVYLFYVPVAKNFSYHFIKGECDNKASWIYHRIFEDNRNIDIVFSGASQTGCAVMDKLIEEELCAYSEEKINVVNLGFCRRGRDIQYIMLNDLFKNKNPKILVLEVAEDEPKKSHPVFPYLANTSELFSSGIFYNQRYLTAIWKGIIVRFEYLKFRIFKSGVMSTAIKESFGYRPSSQTVSIEKLEKNSADWEKRLKIKKSKLLRRIELNYSKNYLEKIVNLANRNNCKILFLYLPESGSNLRIPLLSDYYKNLSDLVILPESIINNKSNWKDATHFNDLGAVETSEYIIDKFKI